MATINIFVQKGDENSVAQNDKLAKLPGKNFAAPALVGKEKKNEGKIVLRDIGNKNAPTGGNFHAKGGKSNINQKVKDGEYNNKQGAAAPAAAPFAEKKNVTSNNNNVNELAAALIATAAAAKEAKAKEIAESQAALEEACDGSMVCGGTPMSVTDALSPMSVDRSTSSLSTKEMKLNEKNNNDVVAEKELPLAPQNDRNRFYEVLEYQESILEYLRESEKKRRPKVHYMRRQTDINYSMRTILVDWLVEVSEEYELETETLYLSISYIDRFLSHMSVVRSKLQLVGTAAMYIASKYEEIYPPDVSQFCFITDDTYTRAQVLRMEQIILKILAFDLCTPTAYAFIRSYAVMTDMPHTLKHLTLYLSELSLLDAERFLCYTPSMVSAGSLALARCLCNLPIWTPQLEEITDYRLEDLKEIFLRLSAYFWQVADLPQQAVQTKYKAKKYSEVANMLPVLYTEEAFNEMLRAYNKSTEIKTTSASSGQDVRHMISSMLK